MADPKKKIKAESFVPFASVLDGPPDLSGITLEPAPEADEKTQGLKELRKSAKTLSRRATTGIDPNDPQTRLLSQTIMLEEAGASNYSRRILVLGAALVIASIAWASVTTLDEVASGPGRVVPEGAVKVVQHLEGGIVQDILVRDGDRVKKGQVVLRLKGDRVRAEQGRLRGQLRALSLRAARLQAFVSGKPLPPVSPSDTSAAAKMAREELSILRLQEKARRLQRDVLTAQISQSSERLKSLRASLQSLQSQFKSVEEAYALRSAGVKKGVVARSLFLQTRRDYERAKGDIGETRIKIQRAVEAMTEARAKLAEYDARVRSDALTERGKVVAEVSQVEAQLAKVNDQIRRLEIRAPVDGVVKGLQVTTVGAVVTADGKPLMEVVPGDSRLIVEARISTRDVGHIKPGQIVKLKVDTYDFARFGALLGKIENVSATTFLTSDGVPYYRAKVVIDRGSSTPRAARLRLNVRHDRDSGSRYRSKVVARLSLEAGLCGARFGHDRALGVPSLRLAQEVHLLSCKTRFCARPSCAQAFAGKHLVSKI